MEEDIFLLWIKSTLVKHAKQCDMKKRYKKKDENTTWEKKHTQFIMDYNR